MLAGWVDIQQRELALFAIQRFVDFVGPDALIPVDVSLVVRLFVE